MADLEMVKGRIPKFFTSSQAFRSVQKQTGDSKVGFAWSRIESSNFKPSQFLKSYID